MSFPTMEGKPFAFAAVYTGRTGDPLLLVLHVSWHQLGRVCNVLRAMRWESMNKHMQRLLKKLADFC
jgi:hypothetical protein